MSEFTYTIPFSMESFMKGIIYELKNRDKYDIASLLKGPSVEVSEGNYSHYCGGGRWDALSAYINFYVNPQNKKLLDTDNTKDNKGNIRVFASIYDPNADNSELLPIKSEKEWKIIETILESIQEENNKDNG